MGMFERWSFGQKIATGFAITVLLTIVLGVFAVFTIGDVARSKDVVIVGYHGALMDALRLDALVENHVNANRGFLLTRDGKYIAERDQIERDVAELLARLKERASGDLVSRLEAAMQVYKGAAREYESTALGSLTLTDAEKLIVRARPARDALSRAVDTLIEAQERAAADENARAGALARSAINWVIALGLGCAAIAVLSAVTLTRVLGRQLSVAVVQMRSSSAELQAAAGQQASGLREQASAMTEVNTTINQLQASSRQIAESAQRVAQLASETAAGARQGTTAVTSSKQAIDRIAKQVDQIVTYMLELGRKSQHIGTVLDLVSELAEQTNILAINATIEATGAGEAGRRFLVVADEIRKLADRVGGSTKEVRALIEDVRSAVNTTVMATETGAKAVESGSRQFEELTQVFAQIFELVAFVTQAAREIELSTKQQASAVEQVNIAVASVAQATREGEASSSQTLQTAAQLAALSQDLVRIMQEGAVN
jgi:methyl-accepting chemotaxis protein